MYLGTVVIFGRGGPATFDMRRICVARQVSEGTIRDMHNFACVEEVGQRDRSGGGMDIGALIGQGMSVLRSQGGKDGKGDFASKFLNK